MYTLVYRTLCQFSVDDYPQMYELITTAEDELVSLGLSDNTYLQTDIAYFKGLALFELGYTYESLSYYQTTNKLYNSFTTFDFRVEDLYSNTAICYFDIADYDNAIVYLNKSINSESKNVTALDKIQWIGLKAKAYQYKGNLDLAESYYSEAFELLGDYDKKDTRVELQLNDDWSSFLILTKQFEKAESVLQRVKSMKPLKGDLINYYQNQGNYFLKINQIEQSITYFSKATEQAIALYGKKHYEVGDSYLKAADGFLGLKEYDDALHYYTEAINAISSESAALKADSDVPDVELILTHKLALEAQFQKAIIYSKLENYEASKNMSRSVLEILEYMLSRQIVAFGSKIDLVNYIRSYVTMVR